MLVLPVFAAHADEAKAQDHAAHVPVPAANTARSAYDQSMVRMHDDMMRGIAHDDADVAFAAGMLAHHVGAVEMARIELQYGKDAILRKLAEEVIRAQEAEIALLTSWLHEKGLSADGSALHKAADAHAGH
ncbi:DUF305 domain-containing protein [Lampropedia puyangensis]|uniref:DUF305 domain-containing protein n=2 Tax=Lampropedia puyangensis TaxID=1330072 RepID=A0A4S8F4Z6_9BURK|nr:DUF305 domain-containing protein [Lampropedia puyangensis]